MTLLKNEQGLLPLSRDIKKLNRVWWCSDTEGGEVVAIGEALTDAKR